MQRISTDKNHSGTYVAKMKTLVSGFIIGIIFLARTTGALQQSIAPIDTLNTDKVSNISQNNSSKLSSQGDSDDSNINQDTPTNSDQQTTNDGGASSGGSTTSTGDSSSGGGGGTTGASSDGGSGGGSDPAPDPTPDPTPDPDPPALTYRNGTYSADGSYDTPAGTQKIGITLVIVDDVVVDTSATRKATNPTSKTYQDDFIANYKSQVVGKKLSSLNLSKISGSSLTPNGFNNATNLIRSQAS